MQKKFRLLLPIAGLLMLTVSCRQQRDIAYVKDAARDSAMTLEGEFSKGIQANDILYIYVESQTPLATVLFNQETNKIAVNDGTVMNPGSGAVQGYLVNQDGYIIFPVLGKVKVLGLTHNELAKMLEDRLKADGHVVDPVVTVKLMNFRVCVLGDVARPGQLVVQGERLTIFEALSMVGDLKITGQRENVTIIREENGKRIIGSLNLASKDVFNSPYYYLHQNDVVYVEPNKKTRRNADRDPIVMTYISSGLSVISVLSSMFYYWTLSKYYNNR
jgi:polysaccharide export outer membrane protein